MLTLPLIYGLQIDRSSPARPSRTLVNSSSHAGAHNYARRGLRLCRTAEEPGGDGVSPPCINERRQNNSGDEGRRAPRRTRCRGEWRLEGQAGGRSSRDRDRKFFFPTAPMDPLQLFSLQRGLKIFYLCWAYLPTPLPDRPHK